MKSKIITVLLCLYCLLAVLGCEPDRYEPVLAGSFGPDGGAYEPARIEVLPLSEFVVNDTGRPLALKVYVDLLDAFGSRMKSPAVFRFELYVHVPRSTNPRGNRVAVWPDVDLTEAVVNHSHWRDFLRAYEFALDLDFEPEEGQSFVLQATCIRSDGKRLMAELNISRK